MNTAHRPQKAKSQQQKVSNRRTPLASACPSADAIWLSVFAFSARAVVGLKFAQLSAHLDALADKHLAAAEHFFGTLHIRRAEKGEGAEIVKFDGDGQKVLPIEQQRDVPDNVIGFRRLSIGFVDHTVVAFLRRIRRLLSHCECKIVLDICDRQKFLWDLLARNIWPLLTDGMCTLDCLMSGARQAVESRLLLPLASSPAPPHPFLMRRHFASSVLSDCAKLRLVLCFGILPQAPPDVRSSATVGQALCAWLHTPRGDGRPKVLKCVTEEGAKFAESVRQLKELFLAASSPANFFVHLSASSFSADFAPFDVENGKTLERFTARLFRHSFWLLERAPNGRDERKWAEWEREVIGRKRWHSERNVIRLAIGQNDIGPLYDHFLRSRTPKMNKRVGI